VVKTRIILACESLLAGNGGMARVDRLMTPVLRAWNDGVELELHIFSDAKPPADLDLPERFRCYGGSRIKFALGLGRALLRPGHFIYNAAYLARLHRGGPGGRRRSLVFLHGIEVWENAKRANIAACRRADLLVANSQHTRDRADRIHGGFARARVCWLGTEANVGDAPARRVIPGPPIVLVVGRMQAREGYKGHRELIAAWPQVLVRHPDARLKFVGRGDLVPQLAAQARESNVAHRVDFTGFVSEEELAACYRDATIFALPSRGEGFGLVYIEAMRHGLPVVASCHDAGAEIVQDGCTGLLANLDAPGALAARLTQLLDHPDEARRMGEAGRERWRREFTFEAFRTRFEGVLREFLPASATEK
jgi:phosphatidylinositol alpha-1,6-mannosyltransferase